MRSWSRALLGYPAGGPWIVLLPLVVALSSCRFSPAWRSALAALAVHFKDVRDLVANLLTLALLPDADPLLDRRGAAARPARAHRAGTR